MGWWSIATDKEPEAVNGDGPADILGAAFDKVVKEWENEWGRKPTQYELLSACQFASGHLELEDTGEQIDGGGIQWEKLFSDD